MAPSRRNRPHRRGVAAVEMAACLPLILLLFLSSIDAANAVYLKQTATAAAYEAARVATAIGGTELMATTRATEVLTARNVAGATISVSPTVDADTARGTVLTIDVSVPCNAIRSAWGTFSRGVWSRHGWSSVSYTHLTLPTN